MTYKWCWWIFLITQKIISSTSKITLAAIHKMLFISNSLNKSESDPTLRTHHIWLAPASLAKPGSLYTRTTASLSPILLCHSRIHQQDTASSYMYMGKRNPSHRSPRMERSLFGRLGRARVRVHSVRPAAAAASETMGSPPTLPTPPAMTRNEKRAPASLAISSRN